MAWSVNSLLCRCNCSFQCLIICSTVLFNNSVGGGLTPELFAGGGFKPLASPPGAVPPPPPLEEEGIEILGIVGGLLPRVSIFPALSSTCTTSDFNGALVAGAEEEEKLKEGGVEVDGAVVDGAVVNGTVDDGLEEPKLNPPGAPPFDGAVVEGVILLVEGTEAEEKLKNEVSNGTVVDGVDNGLDGAVVDDGAVPKIIIC